MLTSPGCSCGTLVETERRSCGPRQNGRRLKPAPHAADAITVSGGSGWRALVLTVVLWGAVATAQTQQTTLDVQQNDNKVWLDAAKKLESDLLADGQKFQAAKDFSRAADCYRRAQNITFDQWDIQESRGINGTVTYSPSLRKVRRKLDTANSKTIRDKLAGLDAAILTENENIFRKNVSDWTTDARDAVKDKKPEGYTKAYVDYQRIIAAAARLPQSKTAGQESTKAGAEVKKIVAIVDEPLDAVEKTLKEGKTADAVAKLNEFYQTWRVIADDYPEFRKRVAAVRADPEVRKHFREQEAAKKIEAGDAAVAKGDYVSAMRQYRGVVVSYSDLDISQKASEKLGELIADPKAAEDLKELDAETRCRVTMARIDSLMRMKKYAEARPLCVKLAADNPDTVWATRATEAMEVIKKETG